jgi:hypothetical protein
VNISKYHNIEKQPMTTQLNPDQQRIRESLLKLFKAPPGARVLTEEEFKEVQALMDPEKGGLKIHAFHQFKDDRELLREARRHQEAMSKTLYNVNEIREPLLKLFKREPGQKPLTETEFNQVRGLVARYKGGLNQRGYDLFKEDKEVIDAARAHISAVRSRKPAKDESLKEAAAKAEKDLSSLQKRRSQESSQSAGMEVGD